jgi:hypothetical protein
VKTALLLLYTADVFSDNVLLIDDKMEGNERDSEMGIFIFAEFNLHLRQIYLIFF